MHNWLGIIRLSPGISPANATGFLLASVAGVCIWNFVPLILPFYLAEVLNVPQETHGRIAGAAGTAQSLTQAFMIPIMGVLADRYGRRKLIVFGLGVLAVGVAIYPTSQTIPMLIAFSVVLAIGQAGLAAGGNATVADYPDNVSRGKFVSLMVFAQQIATGVIVGQLGARSVIMLSALGLTTAWATRSVFWVLAMLGVAGLLTASFGMAKEAPRRSADRGWSVLGSIFADVSSVLSHARQNPRFRLVLIVACIMRSDFALVYGFLSLWVMTAARAEGVSAKEAVSIAGALFTIVALATTVFPPLFGWLADRLDRVRLTLLALALIGSGFAATALVSSINSPIIYAVAALIGVGEAAVIVASQTLLGEEAPPQLRGASVAVFIFLGLLGVTVANFTSGILFDTVSPIAPFLLLAFCNWLCLSIGWLYVRHMTAVAATAK